LDECLYIWDDADVFALDYPFLLPPFKYLFFIYDPKRP